MLNFFSKYERTIAEPYIALCKSLVWCAFEVRGRKSKSNPENRSMWMLKQQLSVQPEVCIAAAAVSRMLPWNVPICFKNYSSIATLLCIILAPVLYVRPLFMNVSFTVCFFFKIKKGNALFLERKLDHSIEVCHSAEWERPPRYPWDTERMDRALGVVGSMMLERKLEEVFKICSRFCF